MQHNGIVAENYDHHNYAHVSSKEHVETVARSALRNIPNAKQLLDETFNPTPFQDPIKYPEIYNMEMYDPYQFGR